MQSDPATGRRGDRVGDREHSRGTGTTGGSERVGTRRGVLAAVGVGASTALAGCGLLGGGADGAGATGTDGTGADRGTGGLLSPGERRRVVPDRVDPRDHFGASVSLADGTAIVGAPGDSDRAADAGVAYVLAPGAGGNWHVTAELAPETAHTTGLFGIRVEHDGDHALVAANFAGGESRGAVYWFRRRTDGWERRGKVSPEPPGQNFNPRGILGGAMAMAGQRALVAATPEFGSEVGRAYVLRRGDDGWRTEAELKPRREYGEDYGAAVALGDGVAAVGDPSEQPVDGTTVDGAVYVYERVDGEWERRTLLRPPAPVTESRGRFGASVAFAGDTLLVGAPAAEVDGTPYAGAIHAFRGGDGGVTRTATFAPTDARRGEELGSGLAGTADTAILAGGRPQRPTPEPDYAPPVYAFERGAEWTEERELAPDDGVHHFGASVAVDGRAALVGTQEFGDQPDPARGAVYLFGL